MGSAWLAISGPGPQQREALFAAATSQLPFSGGTEHAAGSVHPDTELRAWTIVDDVTRGVAFATSEQGSSLAFDGWVCERWTREREKSVAENVLSLVHSGGAQAAASLDGQFSWCVYVDGVGTAAGGFLQGMHVYAARKDGVVALSNRALLVSSVVNGPNAAVDPMHLGWLLTGVACPFGNGTCWPNVRLVEDATIATISAGHLQLRRWTPAQPTAAPADWDAEASALAGRVATVSDLPNATIQMALTGGKDSRLILAAARSAGVLDSIDRFYLKAVPEHPDAKVAKLLAAHVGRELDVVAPPQAQLDIFKAVRLHLFCAEAALGAWDHKGAATKEPVVGVHGNFGEIYKSHARPTFLLGWPVARRYYSGAWLNPNSLLKEHAVSRYRDTFTDWLSRCRQEKTPLSGLHDRWHREARIGRWLGQTLQYDACAAPAINPIPSRSLLSAYLSLPWRDRRDQRLHLELMDRLDPEIWQLPLANDRWKRRLLKGLKTPQPPVTGNVLRMSPQFVVWQRQQAEICEFLMAENDSGLFFELVDRDAIQKHLAKARNKPTSRLLEPIYALIGIKMALIEGVIPAPFTVASS